MRSNLTVRGYERVFHLKRTPDPHFRKKENVDSGESQKVVCTVYVGNTAVVETERPGQRTINAHPRS